MTSVKMRVALLIVLILGVCMMDTLAFGFAGGYGGGYAVGYGGGYAGGYGVGYGGGYAGGFRRRGYGHPPFGYGGGYGHGPGHGYAHGYDHGYGNGQVIHHTTEYIPYPVHLPVPAPPPYEYENRGQRTALLFGGLSLLTLLSARNNG